MSLIKLALVMTPKQIEQYNALRSTHGFIQGNVAQHHYQSMLEAGKKVNEVKTAIKGLTEAEIQAGKGKVLQNQLAEHVSNVQSHSARLRGITHPGGDNGRQFVEKVVNPTGVNLKNAINASNAAPIPTPGTNGGSLLNKVKDFASKNKGLVAGSAAVAGGAFLLHKLNQRKQQAQAPTYPVYQ